MRLIDADALKDHVKIFNIGCGCSEDYQKSFLNTIDEQPTIQPASCEGCKHFGKWEDEYGYPSSCTRCKRMVEDNYER